MEMKINKNLRTALFTIAIIGTSYGLGKQQGEQTIIERWENRWFDGKIDGLTLIGMTNNQ
jgi:hypothetical protein